MAQGCVAPDLIIWQCLKSLILKQGVRRAQPSRENRTTTCALSPTWMYACMDAGGRAASETSRRGGRKRGVWRIAISANLRFVIPAQAGIQGGEAVGLDGLRFPPARIASAGLSFPPCGNEWSKPLDSSAFVPDLPAAGRSGTSGREKSILDLSELPSIYLPDDSR